MRDNFVSGNYTPKYTTKNPITRYLTLNFKKDIYRLIGLAKLNRKSNVLEVGAGDGHFLRSIIERFGFYNVIATDISADELKKAKRNLEGCNVVFEKENAESLTFDSNSFDLVIACEVLEHINDPQKAILELKRVSKKYILISVPVEPKWRILHFITGKYLKSFGNTPGHINHWSKKDFQSFLNDADLNIVGIRYPVPWWQAYLVRK